MNLEIDEKIDKGLYYKKISNDKVINITGEGGSGKSTLANEYRTSDDYAVVDYDMVFLDPPQGTNLIEVNSPKPFSRSRRIPLNSMY